ncbi:hypothetical protein V6N12_043141 [Hibiscus sabdariffa]|uniref:Zinc finger GRF-type domain-containing protein n=1 Tax=Hibiscus sabdariffa TaxID=183260 RepID=A0ABR2DIC1_9ROSI
MCEAEEEYSKGKKAMDDPTRRPVCYCGLVTEIKTSWTTGNSGRRFFVCKNHASLRHHPPYIYNRRRLALACRMLAWWRLALPVECWLGGDWLTPVECWLEGCWWIVFVCFLLSTSALKAALDLDVILMNPMWTET